MSSDPHALLGQFIEHGDDVTLLLPPGDVQVPTVVRQLTMNRMAVPLPAALDSAQYFAVGNTLSVIFPNITPIEQVQVVNIQREKEPLLWLRLPDDTKDYFYSRRSHARVAIKFPVTISHTDSQGNAVKETGETVNLSGGGMRFLYSHALEKGQVVHLTFQLPNGPEFNIGGEVISCKASPYRMSARAHPYAIAVKFLQMLPAQKDRLMGMCFRYELEQKKHLR